MTRSTWNYTFREILIVIIGISIAFSMNKCADNLKDKRLRVEYLTNLKSDVEADKDVLIQNKTAIDKKIETCFDLIPNLNIGKQQDMTLLGKIFVILKYETFSPKSVTYQTLINSGDLKLISDFQLKVAIQQHYSNYDEITDAYGKHRSLIKDYLGNYLITYADYDALAKNEHMFTDEVKLKNIVRALSTTFEDKNMATRRAIESCDTLIAEIDKALD